MSGYVYIFDVGDGWLIFEKFKSINTYHHIRYLSNKRAVRISEEVLFTQGEAT